MQTFLPYAHYKLSADCLDGVRRWKQCVEVKQLVNAIDVGTQHRHHPACKMWIGYRDALIAYGMECCTSAIRHGWDGEDMWNWLYVRINPGPWQYPPWFGSYHFHSIHRANLMRKLPSFYKFDEKPQEGYFWPKPEYDWRKQATDLFDPVSRRVLLQSEIPKHLEPYVRK